MEKIKIIIDALESVNLFDIVVYDMKDKSPFFEYLVISSSTSERQLKATTQHITNDLVKAGFEAPRVEGKNSNSWVLVDCNDVIVNVFTKEEREHYDLEKMLAEIETLNLDRLK